MNNKKFKKLIPFAVFLALVCTLSSCNRGVGCPSDFSLTSSVIETVSAIPSTLCDIFCKGICKE